MMKQQSAGQAWPISRRAFVQGGTLFLLGAGCADMPSMDEVSSRKSSPQSTSTKGVVRVGLVTDLHYADKQPTKTRHYRETLTKLPEAVEQFSKAKTDLVVVLGDCIDSVKKVDDDRRHLQKVRETLAKAPGAKHFVLGNHCVETLTKTEFLETVGQRAPHYSFDVGDFHFIVLDACYRSDGAPYGRNNFDWTDANFPDEELQWLKGDLESTDKSAIVFAHQRLDDIKRYSANNAAEVRKLLERSGNVEAVFQGHHHRNDYQEIAGIHYCTLIAMVEGSGLENNGYSTLELGGDGVIRLNGFRKQANYQLTS